MANRRAAAPAMLPAPPAVSAPTEVDVAIVGGGMVGASLAAALAGTGRKVLLVESVPFGTDHQPSFDQRTTALGNASRRIFEGLGVWAAIAPTAGAIRTIHVSEGGRFGFARLSAAEQGVDAFGYVVANRCIGAALWQQLRSAPGLTLQVPARVEELDLSAAGVRLVVVSDGGARSAVAARLVVGADGAQSQVRTAAGIAAGIEDYGQVAVVANVATDRPHGGTAYERFTAAGPLAVLPLHDGSLAVIWACRPERAHQLLGLDEAAYLAQLQAQFGWRAGRFLRAGRRASYPLQLTRATDTVATRAVLIGNAAQALHPVAGQGFNLGLRDAAMLAEVIVNSGGDAGAPELLRRFAAWRSRDRAGVVRFTDALVKLFADQRPGTGVLRNLGLLMFDLAPPAKSALARVSAGFGGPTPRLARGLPLRHV
jgi:2-octaprenyl-6-methoxyphenol hydroxylase